MSDDEIESAFKCEKCGKSFSEKKLLIQHTKRKTPCVAKQHKCEDCGKIFENIAHLKRHVNDRKTSCAPIVNNIPPAVANYEVKCHFCGRTYKNRKCLNTHIDKCKIATNKKVFHDGEQIHGMEKLMNIVESTSRKMDEIYIDNKMLKNDVQTLLKKPSVNIEKQYIDNVNIMINCFGDQKTDHITCDDIFEAFKLESSEIMPMLTKKIHSRVENRNIFMPDPNSDKVLVLKEIDGVKRWCSVEVIQIYNKLFKQGLDIIYQLDDDLTAQRDRWDTNTHEKFYDLKEKVDTGVLNDVDKTNMNNLLYGFKPLIIQ
jgi:uncharacterized C2H2 Zn-finger protein